MTAKIPPKHDDEWFVNLVATILAIAIALAILVLIYGSRAKAAEMRHCELYAKTHMTIVLDGYQGKPDPELIAFMTRKLYSRCLLAEQDSLVSQLEGPDQGTVPATDRPAKTYEEACRAEYRTWQASTKTVVRHGSPERVPCPLKLEGGIWTTGE